MENDILMENALQTAQPLSIGEVVNVCVVDVTDEHIIVDAGLKLEGLVPAGEKSRLGLLKIKPGEKVPAILKQLRGSDGHPVFSILEAYQGISLERLQQAYLRKEPVKCVITRRIKGGFLADAGVDCFMPLAHADLKPVREPKDWIGKEVEALVIELDRNRCNVVLSRRLLLEEGRRKLQEETRKTLVAGQVRKGVVTRLLKFGAFVDIGGIEGILHISDISWIRTKKASDVLKEGQEITVKVLLYDAQNCKLALGLKQLLPHPWDNAEARFTPGSIIKGTITGIEHVGVFVMVAPGVEGLVHTSELSWMEGAGAGQVHGRERMQFRTGQELSVKVLSVERQNERLSLSIKRAGENPWQKVKSAFPRGSKISGVVDRITSYGAFVRVSQFPGLCGLVHISDMFWTVPSPGAKDIVSVGQEVEVVVIDVDVEEGRMSLGLRQLTDDPFLKFKKGMSVSSVPARKTPEGIFLSLDTYAEGFIGKQDIVDMPETGRELTAMVVQVNRREKLIKLSMTEYERKQERVIMDKYMSPAHKLTLADTMNWDSGHRGE